MDTETEATLNEDASSDLGNEAVEESTLDQASVDSNVETQETQDSGDVETLNLADVSKILGIDEKKLDLDSDGELTFSTNVNGVKGKANLNKLIMNHQLESHLNSKSMEVSELKKALASQVEESKSQASAKLKGLDDLTKVLQSELLSEFENVDWKDLKENDREDYLFQTTEFQRRKDRITGLVSKLQVERDKLSEVDKESAVNNVAAEQEKLKEAIPEWADDEKLAVSEFTDMSKHAEAVGFSDKEFGNVRDHRALVILRESMLYRKLMSDKEGTLKKVRTAPRLEKGNSSGTANKNTPIEDVFYS